MLKIWSRAAGLSLVAALAAAGSVAAQAAETDEPDPGPQAAVAVSGTSTLVGQAEAGTTTVEGGVVRVRDNVLVTVEQSSDPRVSGRATITVNIDAYPDATGRPGAGQVRYGSMRLENPDGGWSGRFAGSMASGGFVQTYWLEGEGAYEGLSYVVTAGGNGEVWQSRGLIFPGAVPPMGGGPHLPLQGPASDRPTASAPSP